jgi:ABC-2 type transport system permease protein
MRRFNRGLMPLTIANIKSYYRDRAALFWTIAFPVIFVILFGSIFSGGPTKFSVGWVDEDQSAASAQLRQGFSSVSLLDLTDTTKDDALAQMQDGKLDAVIVVPAGLGAAMGAPSAAGNPFQLTLYTDPSKQTASTTVEQIVAQVVGGINQALSGKPPALAVQPQTLQTANLTSAAYFVPSILAMALMQLGIFAAIPLVAQREKQILKRLGATPLARSTLVGSNVFMRLLIALVVLGAVTFVSIGYVIASYARTEDSANTLASVVQFPLMFLSGIFFPIAFMPQWLQPVAAFLPLTYLGDALRQTMVGGAAYAPLYVDVLVLAGWLVVSFVISARYFRWQ